MAKIKVDNTENTVVNAHDKDYISLTDMSHIQMSPLILIKFATKKH